MHRGGQLTWPVRVWTVSEKTFRADTWAQPQRLGQGEEERREQRSRQAGLCKRTARPRDDKLCTENQLGSWLLGFILQAREPRRPDTPTKAQAGCRGGRGRSWAGQAEAATVQERMTDAEEQGDLRDV